jgi:hypothetical protein
MARFVSTTVSEGKGSDYSPQEGDISMDSKGNPTGKGDAPGWQTTAVTLRDASARAQGEEKNRLAVLAEQARTAKAQGESFNVSASQRQVYQADNIPMDSGARIVRGKASSEAVTPGITKESAMARANQTQIDTEAVHGGGVIETPSVFDALRSMVRSKVNSGNTKSKNSGEFMGVDVSSPSAGRQIIGGVVGKSAEVLSSLSPLSGSSSRTIIQYLRGAGMGKEAGILELPASVPPKGVNVLANMGAQGAVFPFTVPTEAVFTATGTPEQKTQGLVDAAVFSAAGLGIGSPKGVPKVQLMDFPVQPEASVTQGNIRYSTPRVFSTPRGEMTYGVSSATQQTKISIGVPFERVPFEKFETTTLYTSKVTESPAKGLKFTSATSKHGIPNKTGYNVLETSQTDSIRELGIQQRTTMSSRFQPRTTEPTTVKSVDVYSFNKAPDAISAPMTLGTSKGLTQYPSGIPSPPPQVRYIPSKTGEFPIGGIKLVEASPVYRTATPMTTTSGTRITIGQGEIFRSPETDAVPQSVRSLYVKKGSMVFNPKTGESMITEIPYYSSSRSISKTVFETPAFKLDYAPPKRLTPALPETLQSSSLKLRIGKSPGGSMDNTLAKPKSGRNLYGSRITDMVFGKPKAVYSEAFKPQIAESPKVSAPSEPITRGGQRMYQISDYDKPQVPFEAFRYSGQPGKLITQESGMIFYSPKGSFKTAEPAGLFRTAILPPLPKNRFKLDVANTPLKQKEGRIPPKHEYHIKGQSEYQYEKPKFEEDVAIRQKSDITPKPGTPIIPFYDIVERPPNPPPSFNFDYAPPKPQGAPIVFPYGGGGGSSGFGRKGRGVKNRLIDIGTLSLRRRRK